MPQGRLATGLPGLSKSRYGIYHQNGERASSHGFCLRQPSTRPCLKRIAISMHSASKTNRSSLFFAAVIVLLGFAAYSNTLSAPFILDDTYAIADNPVLRHPLSSWKEIVTGMRPVVTLTLAFNFALGGRDGVVGYHLFNIGIHLLAALTLFALLRRVLSRRRFQSTIGNAATALGFAVALIWLLHPLQTESVTYTIQRAESLMGLFYLLTLYAVLRAGEGPDTHYGWATLAVIFCALGMGSKEVMITAPMVALLFDRVFLSSSWAELFRRRWGLYLALALTWGILAVPIQIAVSPEFAHGRQGGAGFGLTRVSPLEYAVSQPGVLLHYLRLSIIPYPLCLDYDWPVARTPQAIVPPAMAILALLALTVWAWFRAPALAFLATAFFLILAPTSSIMPILDLAVEHRMYLPLAALWTIFAIAALWFLARSGKPIPPGVSWVGYCVFAAIAFVFGALTMSRNEEYRSDLSIWADVVTKRQGNARGYHNLGHALLGVGRTEESIGLFLKAIELRPDFYISHTDLGNAYASLGHPDMAIAHYKAALKIQPSYPIALTGLASALLQKEQFEEAKVSIQKALAISPDLIQARIDMGIILQKEGNIPGAIAEFRRALASEPTNGLAHYNLGLLFAQQGNLTEAIDHFHGALRAQPDNAMAYNNLGLAQARNLQVDDAIASYLSALKLKPDYAIALNNLGAAYRKQGDWHLAVRQFKAAMASKPTWALPQANLGETLLGAGRPQEAIGPLRRAVALSPKNVLYLCSLAQALAETGSKEEARKNYQAALELQSTWPSDFAHRAWELATNSDPRLRDGQEAMRLATQACQAQDTPGPDFLDALAAATAQAGNFEKAAAIAQKAMDQAQAHSMVALAQDIKARMELYKAGRPFRQAKVP
jgi:tetratricopeptide (TPR) repeat protein